MSLSEDDVAVRRSGIGASDAWRIVLGEGALQVYQRLVHPDWPTEKPNVAMREGTYLEGLAAELYAEQFSCLLCKLGTVRHGIYPFILASIDRYVPFFSNVQMTGRIVEFKRPLRWQWREQWGDPNAPDPSTEVPVRYLIQCAIQMAVLHSVHGGFEEDDLTIFPQGEEKVTVYRLKRDLELEALIIGKLVNFWERHIVPRDPPPPDGSDAAREFLRRRYPRVRTLMRPATEEDRKIALDLALVKDDITAYKEQESALSNILRARVGDAEGIEGVCTCGEEDGSVAWKEIAMYLGAKDADIARFRGERKRVLRLVKK